MYFGDRVEVVAEVVQHGVEEVGTLGACELQGAQFARLRCHEGCQQGAVGAVEGEGMVGKGLYEGAFGNVEPCPFGMVVGGVEAEERTELYEKPEVKIGDALLHAVEGDDGIAHESEEGRIGLHLPDEPVEYFGHEERDGAFAHVEGDVLQRF